MDQAAETLAYPTPPNTVEDTNLETLDLSFDELLAIENPDAILRRAVELARDQIGLARVSIYVLDPCRHFMLGTWGSDSRGEILDEHNVIYAISRLDREAFRSGEEGSPYTAFEGCLIVEHSSRGSEIARPGWATCTPIRRGQEVRGMMLNDDGGSSHVPLDQAKQAQAAILCSVLSTALGSLAGTGELGTVATNRLPIHRMVMAGVAMLAQDPGVKAGQVARQLAISPRRLTRLFETSLGVSFVDYRNRMRLGRLAFLIAKGRTSLQEAAIAAGFDSYAQFQHVSRMYRWLALFEQLAQ